MATILTKKSDTASSVPLVADLTNSSGGAELAVNTSDKRLYTKNASNTVVELGTNPSTLSLPNGTANGVAYLNGSKVVTTGSALTFDPASRLNLVLASATATPTWNAVDAFRITGSSAGENYAIMQLHSGVASGSNGYAFAVGATRSIGGMFYDNNSNALSFTQNSAEGMRLTSTGLGIGTSSPGYKLDVRGVTASGNGTITTGFSYDTGGLVGTFSNHALGILTNGAVVAKFDTSGNLGLGVTPSAWGASFKAFQFGNNSSISDNGSGDAYMASNWRFDGTNNRYITSDFALQYAQENGVHAWRIAPSGTAGNAISFTQAMTLDASGNLLVGVTGTIAASSTYGGFGNEKVTAQSNANVAIFSTTGAANAGVPLTTARGNDGPAAYFFRNGSSVGSISVAGSATSYNTSSDYRLKNITGPVINSGAYIDSLNPVEGTWKADGSTFVGLIAHEAQEASRTKVATGEKDGEQMQSMDYSSPEIIANIIAELKSLRARVAQLESK